MLETKKQITFSGESRINNIPVENYSATIYEDNLECVSFGNNQVDPVLYKLNRTQCRRDKEAFEEFVYKIHDEMIAERNAKQEV